MSSADWWKRRRAPRLKPHITRTNGRWMVREPSIESGLSHRLHPHPCCYEAGWTRDKVNPAIRYCSAMNGAGRPGYRN